MIQEKTPAAVETTTSAMHSAIVAEPHTGRNLIPANTWAGNKPKRRTPRRKARDRKRWPCQSCYICVKPKGPVLQNTSDNAVAAPTDKRGFVMPDFDRSGVSRCGMVYGHGGGYPQGRPHGVIRVLNHHAHPSCFKTRLVASESHNGAKTMTKVIPLVRTAAPSITASRCAAPSLSILDNTTDPAMIALHVQAENALAFALGLLRKPQGTAADLERATARAVRAATLLKRACAAQAVGGAA